MTSIEDRKQRYAEALSGWGTGCEDFDIESATEAVMAVADAEQASIWEGADATPVPEDRWPLPGQVWHQLLTMSPTERADYLFRIFDALAVRERMQRALEEAGAANARMAQGHAERFHRAVERERLLQEKVARVEALVANWASVKSDSREAESWAHYAAERINNALTGNYSSEAQAATA